MNQGLYEYFEDAYLQGLIYFKATFASRDKTNLLKL